MPRQVATRTRSRGRYSYPEDAQLERERGVVADQRRELDQALLPDRLVAGRVLLVGEVGGIQERTDDPEYGALGRVLEGDVRAGEQRGDLRLAQADVPRQRDVGVALEIAVPVRRHREDRRLAHAVGQYGAVAHRRPDRLDGAA